MISKNFPPKKRKKFIGKKPRAKNVRFENDDNSKSKTNLEQKIGESIVQKINNKQILSYNDKELNNLPYKKALKEDKRTFVEYYISLLRINHLLIFSFYYNKKDYNPQIIKAFLFFFFFSVHFTINAIFFTDGTMHEIYIDEGHFDFIYQIPQIIYSSLISAVITTLITYLSLPEKSIIELKQEKNIDNLDSKVDVILKSLKIKFFLFFLISFVLLISFTFYIICFCGVYINTQVHLIKDSLVSFLLSLIYPFGIFFLLCMLRKLSLSDKNKDRECIYKLSQFVQDL